jgi:hypothetical protein
VSPTASDAVPLDTSTPAAAVSDVAAMVDTALGRLEDLLGRLEDLLGRLSDGDLHLAGPGGGWTVAQVVSHISVSTLVWLGDVERLRQDPDLDFFFREEIGHDALGYPPPTVDLARRRVQSTRRTCATCLPATDPVVLDRQVEIPDLGRKTVADWLPLIVGRGQRRRPGLRHPPQPRRAPRGAVMRAAVLTGLREVRLDNRPEPEPRPGWVVVRVESASLCGTDVHQYDGRIHTPFPRVPGRHPGRRRGAQ